MKTTDLSAQPMARQTALLDFDSRRNCSQIIFTLTQHLKDKDNALKAKLKKRDHQLFGRKSEKRTTQSESQKSSLTVSMTKNK